MDILPLKLTDVPRENQITAKNIPSFRDNGGMQKHIYPAAV